MINSVCCLNEFFLLERKQYMLKQVESATKRSMLLLTHLTAAQFCTSDMKSISENITASGSSSVILQK